MWRKNLPHRMGWRQWPHSDDKISCLGPWEELRGLQSIQELWRTDYVLYFDIHLMASYETHACSVTVLESSDLWNSWMPWKLWPAHFKCRKCLQMSTVEVLQTLWRSMKAKKSHCRCHLRSDFWTFAFDCNDNPQSDLLQGLKPESMANQNGLT